MKIAALIRTLNEEANIIQCCNAYQFADMILIADGGSIDNTIEIALAMPKTYIRNFDVRVECQNGIWRNPDAEHLNFLYDWAHEKGADWIISQDCDQRPNIYLQQNARKIMEETNKDFLMGIQFFLWKEIEYFPLLTNGGGTKWMHGLWAWRANTNIRAIDKMPHYEFSLDGGKTSIDLSTTDRHQNIDLPNCYLHHGWNSDEKVNFMIEYYRKSGLIPEQAHPLDFGGETKPIEEWMIEK